MTKRPRKSYWDVRIFQKPYKGDGVPVRLTSPIMNPDSAPAVIEIEGKMYLYGGYAMGGDDSFIRYNLTKPRKGKPFALKKRLPGPK